MERPSFSYKYRRPPLLSSRAEMGDHLAGKPFEGAQDLSVVQATQVHVHMKVRNPQFLLQHGDPLHTERRIPTQYPLRIHLLKGHAPEVRAESLPGLVLLAAHFFRRWEQRRHKAQVAHVVGLPLAPGLLRSLIDKTVIASGNFHLVGRMTRLGQRLSVEP